MPKSHEAWLLVIILVLCLALAATTRSFLTLRNLVDLLTTNAVTGIFGAGLLVVLIAGGIDISFTATASVAQYVALTIANRYQVGWAGLIVSVVVVGILCGAVNGVLVYRFRIKSVIVSIATLNIMFGLLIWFTDGVYITDFPDWFGNGIDWLDVSSSGGDTFYVNLQMVLLLVAFLSTTVLLYCTNIGRQIFAMGGNPEAAQRLAFNVFGLVVLVYVYMGVMAGLASLAQAQLAQSVIPSSLVGKELDVVAAVVLGGASLLGGKGSVLGTLLGLTLLAVLQNGLTLVGVSSYWLQFFTGCVILGAVILAALEGRQSPIARRSPT